MFLEIKILSNLFKEDKRLRIDYKKILSSLFVNNNIIKIIGRYLSNFTGLVSGVKVFDDSPDYIEYSFNTFLP